MEPSLQQRYDLKSYSSWQNMDYCKTAGEELVYQKNRDMEYVDEEYHDFILPYGENSIRVEVISIERTHSTRSRNKNKNKIKFKIRRGVWLKSLGSDMVVFIETNKEKFYVGRTDEINKYIDKQLQAKPHIRDKSFRPRTGSGKSTFFQQSPQTLEELTLLESYPLTEMSSLSDYIREMYDRKS
jgi:hypothetical protein